MQVNESGLDLFKEIGNIGSGNAATALSTLLNTTVHLKVPKCAMVPFSEATDIIGGPETIVAAVLMQMSGDMHGFIMLVQKIEDAIDLVENLTGASVDAVDAGDYEKLKAALLPMGEVGNILIGSYLSAVADMAQMMIVPSVPMFSVDMLRAVMDLTAVAYGEVGEEVLQIDTEFIGESVRCAGHYFLIPTIESYEKLVKAFAG